MKKIAEKLRTMRQGSGYSQQYIADSLGVSISTISRMENNPATINLAMFARIAEFYGVEFEKIFSDAESEVKEHFANMVIQVSIPAFYTSKFLFYLAKKLEQIELQKE
jgi:transcriptional regulator with XRE-family HTH domain